jgi:hypothetical protein
MEKNQMEKNEKDRRNRIRIKNDKNKIRKNIKNIP